MSWRFPKFPIKAGRIPDSEDTNDNFIESAEEVGGELNEHNWAKKGIVGGSDIARTDVSRDDVFLWHSIGDQRAAGFPAASQLAGTLPHSTMSDNAVTVSSASSWVAVPTTQSTFTSPNTLLWIHVSLQAVQDREGNLTWMRQVAATGNWPAIRNNDTFSNLSVGIGVDGVVIPESVVGGAEPDNDRNYGLQAGSMPVATSVVIPVTAGQHTISIMARVGPRPPTIIGGQNADNPREGVDGTAAPGNDIRDRISDWEGKAIVFGQREVIVLEMRR
jgi:hypothetical protein